MHSLLNYGESTSTNSVFTQMQEYSDTDAEKRLLALMRILRHKEFATHDLAIRNMASWNKEVGSFKK